MGFSAQILADSMSPDGVRLTTMTVVYPRVIHGEMLRHRVLSRCAASSRAIPIARFIEQVENDPYIPTHWGKNQAGMQANEAFSDEEARTAQAGWLNARDRAVDGARGLMELGLHKQIVNRLLEPWMWTAEVITGTEWDNFFHLRIHPAANPEIQVIAQLMKEVLDGSKPRSVDYGQWHLPLLNWKDEEAFCDSDPAALPLKDKPLASIGRCARVSYLRHTDESDIAKDIERAQTMLTNGHMSPLEHVARPMTNDDVHEMLSAYSAVCGIRFHDIDKRQYFIGNFRGWVQYRKTIPGEADILGGSSSEKG